MQRRTFLAALAGAGVSSVAGPVAAQQGDFSTWLAGVRREGLQRGLSARALDEGLADVSVIDRVIELDRRQPESSLTFDEYITRVVPQTRVDSGRARMAENRDLLARISARYGVQSRFIVTLWAIESDFGRITGNFQVISALATLAFEGRRAAFFRDELFNALKIIDRGHIAAREMRGSWAGAMGQTQFMPSSYLNFATDFDGDGRADIWATRADVFASIANYLSRSGWKADETWGREVRLPPGFDKALIERDKVQKSIADWNALGVRTATGDALPTRNVTGSLVQPGGAGGPTLLVYANYRTILRWNRSNYFATAVGYLSDRIGNA
jgi:membrane-bound lytic murein transglycosylase B